jgi:hypothetical protein
MRLQGAVSPTHAVLLAGILVCAWGLGLSVEEREGIEGEWALKDGEVLRAQSEPLRASALISKHTLRRAAAALGTDDIAAARQQLRSGKWVTLADSELVRTQRLSDVEVRQINAFNDSVLRDAAKKTWSAALGFGAHDIFHLLNATGRSRVVIFGDSTQEEMARHLGYSLLRVTAQNSSRQFSWADGSSEPVEVPSQCLSSAARANQEYTVQDSVLGPIIYQPLHFTELLKSTETCPGAPSESLSQYCQFAVRAQRSDVLIFHLGEHFKSAKDVRTELGSILKWLQKTGVTTSSKLILFRDVATQHFLNSLGTGFYVDWRKDATPVLPKKATAKKAAKTLEDTKEEDRGPCWEMDGERNFAMKPSGTQCDPKKRRQCGPIERPATSFQNDALVRGLGESSIGRRLHWQTYTADRWDMRTPPGFSKSGWGGWPGFATAHDRAIVSRKTADCTHFFPQDALNDISADRVAHPNDFPALAAEPRSSVWMLGALLYQPLWDEVMLEILEWAVKSGNDEWRSAFSEPGAEVCNPAGELIAAA